LTLGEIEFSFQFQNNMIVCLCRRVSDATIRATIDGGAQTVSEVGDACGAGTGCGACRDSIDDMIRCPEGSQKHCSRTRHTVLSPYLAIAGEGT
jgi:bacterioferritin-associated ferredoxin